MTTNPFAASRQAVGVTVTGVDLLTSKAMVIDNFGTEFEVDASIRAKGLGFPKEGEFWILAKKNGQWVFQTQVGAPLIETIEGDRQGLHPIATQMLEALAEQGMFADATTLEPAGNPVDPFTPDSSLGGGETPGDHEEGDGANPIDPPQAGGTPGPRPPTTTVPTPTPATPPKYTDRWVDLYGGTFNVLKDLGPATAEADIRKLTKTKVQVVGLQECHDTSRNGLFNRLNDHGWGVWRPQVASFSDENTIIYRDADFTRLDQGVFQTSTEDVNGMPTRYLNWVKLHYKPANRVIYFMSTHLDPKLDTPKGGPNFGGRPWVHQAIAQINGIAGKMQTFGKYAPVITAGDFNLSAPKDAQFRYPGFPFARFGRTGTRSNWYMIKHRPHGRLSSIDHVYLTRGDYWQIRFADHWGYTGYRSDHRPGVVKFRIRAKK